MICADKQGINRFIKQLNHCTTNSNEIINWLIKGKKLILKRLLLLKANAGKIFYLSMEIRWFKQII